MFFAAGQPAFGAPLTVPSPVGGINAYNSLPTMQQTDAVSFINWWPQPYGCSLRNGYIEWITGLPSSVESLAVWTGIDTSSKFFAWSGTGMYDISSRGVAGAALLSGLSNARWEHTQVTNAAGSNLICVNGVDNAIIYKSGGVARITAGDGITLNTWAGISPVNVVQVCMHQHRLWAVEKNSTAAWYLPIDAVQGTFVKYDFGALFTQGGKIQYLATWTLDDGSGAQDNLVIVSTEGEVVVFAGTNPNDSTKWNLRGQYFIGTPVAGFRGYTKSAGDLLILTHQGIVSMTSLLVSTKVQERASSITSTKIQFLISELVSSYSTLQGWEVIYNPKINMLLIAVPLVVSGSNLQLVSNQIINAWSQFYGMDAASWGMYETDMYFGDYSGRVLKAWTGNSDDVKLDNTGGTGVTAYAQQAYSYLGTGPTQKQVGLYRPTFVTGDVISYAAAIVYDYQTTDMPAPDTGHIGIATGALWNTGLWNSGIWGGGTRIKQEWSSAEGVGFAVSLKLAVQAATEVLWVSTDYFVKKGNGIL